VINRVDFLDCPLDVCTMDESVSFIRNSIQAHRFTQHVVVNVAKLVNMRKDPLLDDSVRACDLINIDGMGIVFGARFLGYNVPERVAGVDLFHRLISMSADCQFPVFLLGAKNEVVSSVAVRLQADHPNLIIAGFNDGYFWDDEKAVVDKIKSSGARLLFVAITSPKKEIFINRWKRDLGVDFVMGVGGTFDVVAGKVRRAPVWMQNSGLEWFFRVLQEPNRMWKRYFLTNFEFLVLLIKEKFR